MKKIKINKLIVFFSLCLLFSGFMLKEDKTAYAATPVTVDTVDYQEENIIVNNGGNKQIYFATDVNAAKENWEIIDADPGSAGKTTVDFSWLSPSMDNVLVFRGESDKTQTRVYLNKKTIKLEVSINYANINSLPSESVAPLFNIMTTEGTAQDPVTYSDLEWKKGEGGDWKAFSALTLTQLKKYQVMGTTLYFRIGAKNDNGNGLNGRRPSNEVKLKITKQSPAMVYGIDGSKFNAAIKYGKEYRVTIDGGTASNWIKVEDRGAKNVSLATIANDSITTDAYTDCNGTTKAFPKMDIEVREYATSKATSSKITFIPLDKQYVIPAAALKDDKIYPTDPIDPADVVKDADGNPADLIYVNYNGNRNIIITIPNAAATNPYEYCIVKDSEFSLNTARWSTISKGAGVKVAESKASDGSKLYIRRKEVKSKASTKTSGGAAYRLASTYVVKDIKYPSVPEADKKTLVYTRGYPSDLSFTVTFNKKGKEPFETKIKSIRLGTKEIRIVDPDKQEANTVTDSDGVKTLKVTLLEDDVKLLSNCSNKSLTIYYEKGTVDKTSIRLTVQPPVKSGVLSLSVYTGTSAGTASVKVATTCGIDNKWVYTVGSDPVPQKYTADTMTTGSVFNSGDNIQVTAGQYVTIYEVTKTGSYIMKCNSIQIPADKIMK